MGLPMARRLIDAGYRVLGSDVAETARAAVGAAGGESAPTAAEAAASADVVILMLPNSDVVESVVGQVETSLREGTFVVDMSSSEPLRTRALAARLSGSGVRFVDAPVSGGVRGATAGTLTIMVGGDPDDIEPVRPVLEPLGRVVVAGPVGAGHAAKAINNLMSAIHLWGTGEGVEIGRRFGIEPSVLIEIVNGSSGRSGSSENKWPNYVLPGTFDSGFAAGLMLKDIRIAVGLAAGVGAAAPLGEQAVALWTQAVDVLGPAADHTEIGRWIADGDQL
jgi:3-hydroxyisobutyrate dehydrogenase